MDAVIDVNALFGPLPVGSSDLPVESLLDLMQRHQVDAVCALSTLGLLLDPTVGNTVTRATCAEHSQLRPVATLNPKMYFGDPTPITRLRADGFCMVRFFPYAQGWPPDFAPFRALVLNLREIQLPVMVDIEAPGEVARLSDALGDFPGSVILAGVDTDTLAEAIQVLSGRTSWYLETSHLLAPGAIQVVVDTLGPDRLLFGTYAPHYPIAGVLHTLRHVQLPEENMKLILYENANRVLPI